MRARIASEGAISVADYMAAANAYYYTTRDPLGAAGDFVTAPEISQMFGELVGACLADCWARAGKPENAIYVELGPGWGTLAVDALRVLETAGLEPAAHLVETSPLLRAEQAQAVPNARFHDEFAEVPQAPVLLVANEFLDALPVRQFVDGAERRVVVAAGGLAFDRDGDIVEASPAREEAVAALATRLMANGGVALIIDYGHQRSAPGDTLQAVRGHKFAPVLADPGEQDLTSHVDFEAASKAARDAGAAVTPVVTQREWLERLGISARGEALVRANPERMPEIEAARRRLCDPAQMGELFKVVAIHSPQWPQPAGFE